jgi:hypothetical protein
MADEAGGAPQSWNCHGVQKKEAARLCQSPDQLTAFLALYLHPPVLALKALTTVLKLPKGY